MTYASLPFQQRSENGTQRDAADAGLNIQSWQKFARSASHFDPRKRRTYDV
jgi:hypothetical protein